MKISFVDIQNFRKLKQCRVELSKEKTVFVGANNSGKTSAMDAMIVFLKNKDKANMFALSNLLSLSVFSAHQEIRPPKMARKCVRSMGGRGSCRAVCSATRSRLI